MKRTTLVALALALTSGGLAFSLDGDARGINLYGTVSAEALAGIGRDDIGSNGFENELRLVLEAEDGDLSFRAEGGYSLAYGLSSDAALAFGSGLVTAPDPLTLPPDSDLHRDFFVDQAWARAVLGDFEFKAGIVPVSWGSAYLYNPTARTSEPGFPGEDVDRVRGKPGVLLGYAFPAGFGAEAYALAQGRAQETVPDARELNAGNLPFGCRLFFRSDRVDASLSWIRERSGGIADAVSYAGLDATLVAGAFSLYVETAVPILSDARETEISAGFAWDAPSRGLTIRAEYVRLGGGSADGEYDPTRVLAGETVLLSRDYLYAGAEMEDGENARWVLETGAMINLNDRSVALSSKGTWKPRTTLELAVFVRYFTAALSDSGADVEFGRPIEPVPGISFAPYRSVAGLSAAWSF